MIVAVVPAKDLHDAKMRLATLLGPDERRALYTAMLGDVLEAIAHARNIGDAFVVTREPELMELARAAGALVCEEPANLGHTEAIHFATKILVARGVDVMVTIPGDVPAVTPVEIDALVAALPVGRSVVFAPSRTGLGTNGVVLRPPDIMPLRFGEPSFRNHIAAAEQRGLPTSVIELAGLGLDVDVPADLVALASSTCGSRTNRLLDERLQGLALRVARLHGWHYSTEGARAH